ncbi:alginate biosynthesis protein AlgA [Oxobacter pfennigii]|uniref:mannose-1-phosphate guanylyltransferase n=1 Tax=Oxobacter pfennigii TaxID=36849 RepID=A0A0P9AGI3_9CLOT|nr:mannose-1-phosphate guanylyltransferase [Oxobacter pfennigii]KPU44540.1 alginate biosynthesis protein AlgA [Oxobacter pfennigii]
MDYAVIMSGGMGTRFWPRSRNSMPKQFLRTVGEKTMIQGTVDRISKCINHENICIVTNRNYIKTITKQLPGIKNENIFIEPYNRETATCIGLAAIKLLSRDPDALMIVLPSDHVIQNTREFRKAIEAAIKIARRDDVLVTFGVVPTRPETAYGYIETGGLIEVNNTIPAYKVKRFTEKPNKTVAQMFLDKGTFLWNSGMFVWKAQTLLDEMEKYLPDLYLSLMTMKESIGKPNEEKIIENEYKKVDGISIDFGVMEKSLKITVLKTNMDWDDIGNWNALEKYYLKDDDNNIVNALCSSIDTKNCIIFGNERLIATIGVNNLLVVDAGDTVLICDRERDQDIKEMVKQLQMMRGFDKFI